MDSEFKLSQGSSPKRIVPTPTVLTVDDEGNIHFALTSNGMTPEQWERHLYNRGWRISNRALNMLRRARELPTDGVTYNLVVRPGTNKIYSVNDKKVLQKPHWEIACLIRDAFMDEQLEIMGLQRITTMR